MRPTHIVAPEGTIVSLRALAACGARGIAGFCMIDCLIGALAQGVPGKVAADGSGGSTIPASGGIHNGAPYVFAEPMTGACGGTATHDGQDCVARLGANQSSIPVEVIKISYPLRIVRYGCVADAGDPGRHRGGLSIERVFRFLGDQALLTIRSDKRRFRPFGLFGGCEGSDSLCVINLGGKDEVVLPVLLAEPFQLESGDMYRHVLASGGGCGAPYESDLNDVLNEVVLGLVTVEGTGSTMARRSLAPMELLPLIMRPRPLATEREGYPMPFRLRAKAQRFDRWDIIRTRWRNTEPKDMRTESKRIDHESLVKVRELKKSERHEFACYAIAESLSQENEKRCSFARIRPEDPEFIIQPLGDAAKEENQRPRDTLLSQTDMFSGDSTVLTSEIARHSFHYRFMHEGKTLTHTCIDWETEHTFFKCVASMARKKRCA